MNDLMEFKLSERLAKGGFPMGSFGGCQVLLKNNQLYPWFVLVPEVSAEIEELADLPKEKYDAIMDLVFHLNGFVREFFGVKKVNVGCVGIVVKQLHLHVVGRQESDPAWPGVVWGNSAKEVYTDDSRVEEIRSAMVAYLQQ